MICSIVIIIQIEVNILLLDVRNNALIISTKPNIFADVNRLHQFICSTGTKVRKIKSVLT